MKFHEPVVNECMKMNNFVEEPKMAKAAFSLLVNYEHGNLKLLMELTLNS